LVRPEERALEQRRARAATGGGPYNVLTHFLICRASYWTTTTCSRRGWAGEGSTPRRWRGWRSGSARPTPIPGGGASRGEMGFFSLTQEDDTLALHRGVRGGAGQAFSDFVVLGIGGSALGMIALRSALLKPSWNELSDEERDFFPRIHVLDNVDPATIGPVPRPAGLGAHPVQRRLQERRHGGDDVAVPHRPSAAAGEAGRRVPAHLLFTTDPEKGVLRQLAKQEDIASLPIPASVGGASPSSPPWGCCRRRWWGSTCGAAGRRPRDGRALRVRTTCATTRGALRRAPVPGRTPRPARRST
jgi:hypothetical protein